MQRTPKIDMRYFTEFLEVIQQLQARYSQQQTPVENSFIPASFDTSGLIDAAAAGGEDFHRFVQNDIPPRLFQTEVAKNMTKQLNDSFEI